jgi:hypothetical protein
VVSPRPDAVAVVVYRDAPATAQSLRQAGEDDTSGLAMIAETRTVDLPAGRTRIQFQGVADEIIPASAALSGLPGRLVERDFDYDLLDPGSLIARTAGAPVTVRRLDAKTGRTTEETATLLTGPDGVMVRTAAGIEALGCGAGPEALIFDHLPAGLADRPTLSVVADAPAAGRYTLTLTYLTVAIDWSADYVARLSADGTSLDLTGWLTLSNRSGMSFTDAPTAVVAGDLARVPPDLPDISPRQVTPQCWPMGTTTSDLRRRVALFGALGRGQAMQNVPVAITVFTAARRDSIGLASVDEVRVVAANLGDYKLYSLVEPTTLAARETKQIRFVHQTGVRFETLYVWRSDVVDGRTTSPAPAITTLSFENKAANGLGLPIPAGQVSFRQLQGGRDYYVGAGAVRDVPVNEPFELQLGAASDVAIAQRVVSDTFAGSRAHRRERTALAFTITNAKAQPATVEVRQRPDGEGFRVVTESTPHVLKNGDDVWRVTIPANGTAGVSYTVEMSE